MSAISLAEIAVILSGLRVMDARITEAGGIEVSLEWLQEFAMAIEHRETESYAETAKRQAQEWAGETLYWVMTAFHVWEGVAGQEKQIILHEKYGPFPIGRATDESIFWAGYAKEGAPTRTWLVPAETPAIDPIQGALI